MTSSPGSLGGIRTLTHLRGVLTAVRLIVLPQEISVPFAGTKFNGNEEEMIDEKVKANLESLGAALVEMVRRVRQITGSAGGPRAKPPVESFRAVCRRAACAPS